MPGPDLTFAASALEDLMTMPDGTAACTVLVERDVGAEADSVLNVATGELVRPAGDWSTIYNGKALLRPDRIPSATAEGGATVIVAGYKLTLPLAAAELKAGDRVKVLTNVRDATLVGKVLRVEHVDYRTLAVSRSVFCQLRQDPEDRP